jgi:hypothetical protein
MILNGLKKWLRLAGTLFRLSLFAALIGYATLLLSDAALWLACVRWALGNCGDPMFIGIALGLFAATVALIAFTLLLVHYFVHHKTGATKLQRQARIQWACLLTFAIGYALFFA